MSAHLLVLLVKVLLCEQWARNISKNIKYIKHEPTHHVGNWSLCLIGQKQEVLDPGGWASFWHLVQDRQHHGWSTWCSFDRESKEDLAPGEVVGGRVVEKGEESWGAFWVDFWRPFVRCIHLKISMNRNRAIIYIRWARVQMSMFEDKNQVKKYWVWFPTFLHDFGAGEDPSLYSSKLSYPEMKLRLNKHIQNLC